ncbi:MULTISPECIES: hypothetical protein [Nostocales]|uniref:Uncharacterized protein n=1 Tax=Dolichospermum flos-aquae UHCC 0037 TaxID=2590026 RepID=A0ACC7SAL3_DOLFA|nr:MULTISPECIES: hypothetical protein [Nostocales]MBO1065149.1 hypothetical protein [Anabaena sp. 54]MTJ44869.1 hypothetical protein [Dolichospermum flos-aquae UHCC 0037]
MTNAYITKRYKSSESTKNLIDNLLKGYSSADYHFFVHLYNSTLVSLSRKEEGWVPVSFKLMQQEWGQKVKLDIDGLIAKELIEVKNIGTYTTVDGHLVSQTYSKQKHICREFRIHLSILAMLISSGVNTLEEAKSSKYYDLISGKLINTLKEVRYPKKSDKGTDHPELILDAQELIKLCRVNIVAIKSHIDRLSDVADGLFGGGTIRDNKVLALDSHAYQHILSHTVNEHGDFVDYKVMFSEKGPQMSGRITEAGVGMQNCSRAMKQAGFSGIPNLKNYDLKSSQVWGLIQWFEDANDDAQWKDKIDTTWLTNYLDQDKQVFADMVGVSKDRWKECFLALVMGAFMIEKVTVEDFAPTKALKKVNGEWVETDAAPSRALFNCFYEEANGDAELAMSYYKKFFGVVRPLKVSIDNWQEWLIQRYLKKNSVYPRGSHRVYNRTGVFFNLDDYKNTKGEWVNSNTLKRKLSAFFLQGSEAGFIHNLTKLGPVYGFQTLNNQHDGLVVIGEIPQEAVDIAKERSGLRYAKLEEKGFL